jgi:hypothetical protein
MTGQQAREKAAYLPIRVGRPYLGLLNRVAELIYANRGRKCRCDLSFGARGACERKILVTLNRLHA